MGCCISKCKPKKQVSVEQFNHVVQDKLVISQAAPKTPKIPTSSSNKISPLSPPSPTTSTSSSVSSFTCTNSSNTISSYSSLSSGSSLISSSKDRSFSNDFLWSCIKENPHVIRINSIKECSQLLAPPNVYAKKLGLPAKIVATPVKDSFQQKVIGTGQKRVRSNSPTALNRQKSFRRDSERFDASSYSLQSRGLRSPSPSRRFNGDKGRVISSRTPKECDNYSKRMVNNVASEVNSASTCVSSSLTKEKSRPVISPYIHRSHLLRRNCMMRNRETCIHRISSKIDEIAVEEALAHQDSECVPMEDVGNPHISLDCFIFL